jgi:hypothetical protein
VPSTRADQSQGVLAGIAQFDIDLADVGKLVHARIRRST